MAVGGQMANGLTDAGATSGTTEATSSTLPLMTTTGLPVDSSRIPGKGVHAVVKLRRGIFHQLPGPGADATWLAERAGNRGGIHTGQLRDVIDSGFRAGRFGVSRRRYAVAVRCCCASLHCGSYGKQPVTGAPWRDPATGFPRQASIAQEAWTGARTSSPARAAVRRRYSRLPAVRSASGRSVEKSSTVTHPL